MKGGNFSRPGPPAPIRAGAHPQRFIHVNELETFQQLRNVITGLGVYDDIGNIDFTQSQLGIDDVAQEFS